MTELYIKVKGDDRKVYLLYKGKHYELAAHQREDSLIYFSIDSGVNITVVEICSSYFLKVKSGWKRVEPVVVIVDPENSDPEGPEFDPDEYASKFNDDEYYRWKYGSTLSNDEFDPDEFISKFSDDEYYRWKNGLTLSNDELDPDNYPLDPTFMDGR